MLGIILWAVLIFIIMCYACPGFFTALLVIMVSVFAAYFVLIWLFSRITNFIKKKR